MAPCQSPRASCTRKLATLVARAERLAGAPRGGSAAPGGAAPPRSIALGKPTRCGAADAPGSGRASRRRPRRTRRPGARPAPRWSRRRAAPWPRQRLPQRGAQRRHRGDGGAGPPAPASAPARAASASEVAAALQPAQLGVGADRAQDRRAQRRGVAREVGHGQRRGVLQRPRGHEREQPALGRRLAVRERCGRHVGDRMRAPGAERGLGHDTLDTSRARRQR